MTYPPQPHQTPIVPGAMPPNNDWRPPQKPEQKPERSRLLPWLIGLLALAVLGTTAGVIALSLGMKSGEEQGALVGAPVAAPASAAPIRAADEYDGAQRLAGGLNEAGIACLNWERTENPLNAVDLGSCYVGTEEVVVAIYASHDDAAGEPAYKAALLAGVSDVDVVVGGNWTLSCDSASLCERISRDFGGKHVHISA